MSGVSAVTFGGDNLRQYRGAGGSSFLKGKIFGLQLWSRTADLKAAVFYRDPSGRGESGLYVNRVNPKLFRHGEHDVLLTAGDLFRHFTA